MFYFKVSMNKHLFTTTTTTTTVLVTITSVGSEWQMYILNMEGVKSQCHTFTINLMQV
jgi:hypothetical protein